jgi:hypothetical protein
MTQTKHTPGPWSDTTGTSVWAGEKLVAAVYGDDPECKVDERMAANARLMAAAPDLLFQLMAASNYIDALGGDSKSYRQAIYKATRNAA